MSVQISLPGFDPPQKQTDRLLFAVLPDISVAMHIERLGHALRLKHALHSAPLHAGQLHITLLGLGDHVGLPQYLLAAAAWAASQIAQEAFTVRFHKVLTFRSQSRVSGGYPTVLCSSEGAIGLKVLHQGLVDTLRHIGFRGMSTSFTPHMTLLYDTQKVPEHMVEPVDGTCVSSCCCVGILTRGVLILSWACGNCVMNLCGRNFDRCRGPLGEVGFRCSRTCRTVARIRR